MLLGSGTEVVVEVVVLVLPQPPPPVSQLPSMVKASEGIEPTELSEAMDGPEFSSQ